MEHNWKSYNSLPTLLEAVQRFNDRERVFAGLARLLASYGNVFGVCLVHAHCTLSKGEIMMEREDVSEPVDPPKTELYYPERWLSSGIPYEFTSRYTETPPESLFNEFRAVTGAYEVLGLYYAGNQRDVKLEWTEGRKNVVRAMVEEDWRLNPVETAWNLGKGDPVTMACVLLCATATTEQGGHHLGKYAR